MHHLDKLRSHESDKSKMYIANECMTARYGIPARQKDESASMPNAIIPIRLCLHSHCIPDHVITMITSNASGICDKGICLVAMSAR